LILSHALAAAGAAALFAVLGAAPMAPRSPLQPENMDPAKMQEAMANYMKSIKPSDKHKHLEQFVGDWETTTKMYMMPGAPPTTTKGASHCELIHGGRFLKSEGTGMFKMPGPDGKMIEKPTTNLGLSGYDNNRKLYTMVWTDSMSTALMSASGSLSQDGKTMTMFGEMDEPMTGEVGKTVRYVTRFIDADHHTFEVSEVLYGEPFKVVEIEYVRKGKGATPEK
jgi:hypothetical protein